MLGWSILITGQKSFLFSLCSTVLGGSVVLVMAMLSVIPEVVYSDIRSCRIEFWKLLSDY